MLHVTYLYIKELTMSMQVQYEDGVKKRKCKYVAKLIGEIWEPNIACKPIAVFSQYVNSPDEAKNKATCKPLLAWLQSTLAQRLVRFRL